MNGCLGPNFSKKGPLNANAKKCCIHINTEFNYIENSA